MRWPDARADWRDFADPAGGADSGHVIIQAAEQVPPTAMTVRHLLAPTAEQSRLSNSGCLCMIAALIVGNDRLFGVLTTTAALHWSRSSRHDQTSRLLFFTILSGGRARGESGAATEARPPANRPSPSALRAG